MPTRHSPDHTGNQAIASLTNPLSPDLIMRRGILSLAGDFILPLVREEPKQRTLPWNEQATQIVITKQEIDACAICAWLPSIEQFRFNRVSRHAKVSRPSNFYLDIKHLKGGDNFNCIEDQKRS